MDAHHAVPTPASKRRPRGLRWMVGASIGLIALASAFRSDGSASATSTAVQVPPPPAGGAATRQDPSRVMGVQRADCKKCHPSEVAAWMRTTHYHSADRLLRYEGNTKKYADALGIPPQQLLTTSICADCHGTKAVVNGRLQVVSGVSCESCHGGAGGEDGWLNRHQSYHPTQTVTRQEETPEHRAERLAACDQAGMHRSDEIGALAESCLNCHVISHEALVGAGHKAFGAFDFVPWSNGEVRHNFFLDRRMNAAAPTLWQERTGGNTAARNRVKHVVGLLKSLEVALRKRADMTNPAVIPQIGGFVAAANGKLGVFNATGGTPETQQAAALVAPLAGSIFAPLPTDRETYTAAADKVAELTRQFLASNDGGNLSALDAQLNATPPYYSQRFREQLPPSP